jgi:hypothetical protein
LFNPGFFELAAIYSLICTRVGPEDNKTWGIWLKELDALMAVNSSAIPLAAGGCDLQILN